MKKNKDKSLWHKINYVTQFVKINTYLKRIFWVFLIFIYLLIMGLISFLSINSLTASFNKVTFDAEKFLPLNFEELLINGSEIKMKENTTSLRLE